jgi:APA family basic amino acid/polyamine antiporter
MAEPASVKVFEREATGLVRELSSLDVALLNFAILGFLFTLYFTVAIIPLIGGNYLIGFAITGVLSLFLLYTYYSFHLAMPRSGGDYVFLSRTLSPALGFVGNASFILVLLIYTGITGVTIQTTGFSIGFALLGSLLHSSSISSLSGFFDTSTASLVLGTIEILGLSLPAIFGRRAYFRLQNVIYMIVFIATIIMILLFLTSTNAGFQAAFNSYSATYANTPNYYQKVITDAQAKGWSSPGQSSLYGSLLLVPIMSIFGTSFISSTYVGGEIRRPSKSSLRGMMVAMIIALILAAIFIGALYNTVGFNFLSALDFQASSGGLAIPVIPYANFLALLLTHSSIIIGFVIIAGILQMAIYIPGYYYMASRSLLAYSFDGILPRKISHVHPKYHTPVLAIVIIAALSEISLILLNLPYTAAKIYLFSTVLTWYAAIFPMMLVGIAGIVFPFRRKALFESSPAKARIAGIPVMSLTGIGTVIFTALIVLLELTNPVYFANTPLGIEFVVGAVIFHSENYQKAPGTTSRPRIR